MRRMTRSLTMTVATTGSLLLAACGGHASNADNTPAATTNAAAPATETSTNPAATSAAVPAADTTTRVHHSKLKGALVGAVAGHLAGGHALAGAAAGAVVQHERNKHQ